MRRPMIAGNWKLHKTRREARELATTMADRLPELSGIDIVVAPPFTALDTVASALSGSPILLAAQNCYPEAVGAFTGEISPQLLKDAGCRYVIVGHSERRQLLGETDEFINRKVHALIQADLGVILCIGETLEEREAGRMFTVLQKQLDVGLRGVTTAMAQNLVVAYEPVWAIGTGKTATDAQAQEAHAYIRSELRERLGPAADAIRILYGGSVKPGNIDGLMTQPDVDGALVGGASLHAEEFIRIACFRSV